jgi:hypothetical protein
MVQKHANRAGLSESLYIICGWQILRCVYVLVSCALYLINPVLIVFCWHHKVPPSGVALCMAKCNCSVNFLLLPSPS